MITQIEINGFKTFKDFKVELAPFQVIVGANASGKSNLFDALQLLSRLATMDLAEAFQGLRGSARELFTRLPDGDTVTKMRLAVELLLNHKVRDDAGRETKLQYTRLRYEIEIVYEVDELGPDKLYIGYESLKTIQHEEDTWIKKYNIFITYLSNNSINKQATFIETNKQIRYMGGQENWLVDEPIVHVYLDDQSTESILGPARYVARLLRGTALDFIRGPGYWTISAVREEMRSWKLIHLDPDELRKPSSITGPRFLSSQGGNLPTMLAHMQREDEFALTRVSNDLSYMLPESLKIQVRKNTASDIYDLWVETLDHRVFSVNVLSDGTLRLLALAAIKNDLKFSGVLCLEEPENGVNPLTLEKMTHLLRLLATDFNDIEENDEPLTQVLLTTHSPLMVSQPEAQNDLLFAYTGDLISSIAGKRTTLPITLMAPVVTSEKDEQSSKSTYTIDQVLPYLTSDTLDTARKRLEKARNPKRRKAE
jgi:predicted ATPase